MRLDHADGLARVVGAITCGQQNHVRREPGGQAAGVSHRPRPPVVSQQYGSIETQGGDKLYQVASQGGQLTRAWRLGVQKRCGRETPERWHDDAITRRHQTRDHACPRPRTIWPTVHEHHDLFALVLVVFIRDPQQGCVYV